MKFAIVINVYFDTEPNKKNIFDHPTSLINFNKENTFYKTINSINKLIIPDGDELNLFIFAPAVNEDRNNDYKIKECINNIMKNSKYKYFVFTNSDVKNLYDNTGSEFFSCKGYAEIRTLGLMIPSILNEDIIIQIDDDELLRENYITYLKHLLVKNNDKYLFTAPYEKDGTVRLIGNDKLKCWKKPSSMDEDIVKLTSNEELKETLFGLGGNMIIRRELAEKIFYPNDIPRGEDFSFMLACRLMYANGNKLANLKPMNDIFRAYFCPKNDVTIIHEPPEHGNSDYLYSLEKDLKRFIMEWSMFSNQNKLSIEELRNLSYYMYCMIGYKDIKSKIDDIFDELKNKDEYTKKDIEKLEKTIYSFLNKYRKINRFEEFKVKQTEYINTMKDFKNNKQLKEKLMKKVNEV